jgi:hypothetical protein
VPHRMPNLAQTRHTRPVRNGRTGSNSAHHTATKILLFQFLENHIHNWLADNKARLLTPFGCTRRRTSSWARMMRTILSVCNQLFPSPFEVWPLRSAGGKK